MSVVGAFFSQQGSYLDESFAVCGVADPRDFLAQDSLSIQPGRALSWDEFNSDN